MDNTVKPMIQTPGPFTQRPRWPRYGARARRTPCLRRRYGCPIARTCGAARGNSVGAHRAAGAHSKWYPDQRRTAFALTRHSEFSSCVVDCLLDPGETSGVTPLAKGARDESNGDGHSDTRSKRHLHATDKAHSDPLCLKNNSLDEPTGCPIQMKALTVNAEGDARPGVAKVERGAV